MPLIVKRKGHEEEYDPKKVYASVYAAALNCHYTEEDAEKMAEEVTKKTDAWIKKKKAITSHHIRDQIYFSIKEKEVAMMYREHLDIC